MATKKKSAKTPQEKSSSANLGFESKLWLAADKLRGTMDSGEYKHVVLGLEGLRHHDEHSGCITTGTAAGGRFSLRIPMGLRRNRVENRVPGIHRSETGGDPEIRHHRVGGDGVSGPGVPGAMRRHGSGREGQPDGGGSRQGRGRKGQATRPMRGAVTVLGQPDRRIPGTGLAQIPITANSKALKY